MPPSSANDPSVAGILTRYDPSQNQRIANLCAMDGKYAYQLAQNGRYYCPFIGCICPYQVASEEARDYCELKSET